MYAALLFLCSLLGWVLMDGSVASHLKRMNGYWGCDDKDECDYGKLAAMRVYFSVSLFFAFMALLMKGVKSSEDGRSGLHNGMWGIKLLVLGGTMTGAFFMPNSVLDAWGGIALAAAFLFILIQLVLLVDFAHSWAESWIAKVEDEERCYLTALAVCSFTLLIISLSVSIVLLAYYTGDKDESCSLNKFLIWFNIIIGIALTLGSIHPRVQEHTETSGLLQPAVVWVYLTYLTWSSVANVDDDKCQPITDDDSQRGTVAIGTILTFVSVLYSSLRTSSASQMGKLGMTDQSSALLPSTDYSEEDGDEEGSGQTVVDNERDGVAYSWSFFHMVFALASMYLLCVVTRWQSLSGEKSDYKMEGTSSAMWVKIVSGWLCALLYGWSLVAPICLPDRDFS